MRFSPKQREALILVAEGKYFPALVKEDDGWHARWRAIGVDNDWVDECVRSAVITRLSEDADEQKHETLHDAWLAALKSRTGLVVWNDGECAAFSEELSVWSGNAKEDRAARSRIVFRFSPSEIAVDYPKDAVGLKALGQSIYVFPPLRSIRAGKVTLSKGETEDFLRRGARELTDAGYRVDGADLQVPIEASAELDGERGENPRVRLKVRVAGEEVSAQEIRFLLDQGSSLVFFRNRWIEVDRNILKEALRALEKGVGKRTNPMVFALGLGHIGQLEIAKVSTSGWIRGLLNRMRESAMTPLVKQRDLISGFNGTLHDYQLRGVNWLDFMTSHGFGALLADDMGLGKTAQAIAWMLAECERKKGGDDCHQVLVVAPLTLLSNWQHELRKFAPSLAVYAHQGENRRMSSGFRHAVRSVDVVLTSYNLLVRDYREISEIPWNGIILDEAQFMKNPDTRIAGALRALTPKNRIALTGTPIENSVSDIWSIEEFLNPGFLGDRKSFTERFAKPIALSGSGYDAAGRRLRHALEPFVLRRLKTDPGIVSEMGTKREIREYCALSPAQRAAYEAALEDFRVGEHMVGDVFALITELKLICDGEGKLARLIELLEQIFADGESALVFTQYAKVGEWLKEQIEKRFCRKVSFLHGGLTARQRDAEIARFKSAGPSAFVLSLKAGGFGLNLVKATHVIHFDRWWNPAVENQATDRAHRIGQRQTVFVHLFITTGTIEERVDEILARKESLKGLVSDGEAFWKAARLYE